MQPPLQRQEQKKKRKAVKKEEPRAESRPSDAEKGAGSEEKNTRLPTYPIRRNKQNQRAGEKGQASKAPFWPASHALSQSALQTTLSAHVWAGRTPSANDCLACMTTCCVVVNYWMGNITELCACGRVSTAPDLSYLSPPSPGTSAHVCGSSRTVVTCLPNIRRR